MSEGGDKMNEVKRLVEAVFSVRKNGMEAMAEYLLFSLRLQGGIYR